MIPKPKDIEIPLLEALVELGGQGKTKEIYPLVTKKFPDITEEDLTEILPSGTANKWTNQIQWIRHNLTKKGEMSSPSRGIWAITEKGRQRLKTVRKIPTKQIIDLVPITTYAKKVFGQEIGKYVNDKLKLIKQYPNISEADTTSTIIEPLLQILGWNPQSLEEVQRQYPVKGGKGIQHVDMALKIDGDVKVLLEVKSVSTLLNETDERQVLNYAYNKGIEWCILTNGRELRVYNPLSGIKIQDRILFKLLIEEYPKNLEKINLVSRDNIKRGKIRDWGRERQARKAILNWITQNEEKIIEDAKKNVPSLERTKIQEIVGKFLRKLKSIEL